MWRGPHVHTWGEDHAEGDQESTFQPQVAEQTGAGRGDQNDLLGTTVHNGGSRVLTSKKTLCRSLQKEATVCSLKLGISYFIFLFFHYYYYWIWIGGSLPHLPTLLGR